MYMFHYYGDAVRQLFIGGCLLMLVTLPLFNHLLPVSTFGSVFAILVLVLLAGLTSPAMKWTAWLDVVASAGAVFVFEYFAVALHYSTHDDTHLTWLLWINHILALVFFFAFYYAVKTVRGMYLR
jgi:hypothetical protein